VLERSQGFRSVRNSPLVTTWEMLGLSDWSGTASEMHGSSPRRSSSAGAPRGTAGSGGVAAIFTASSCQSCPALSSLSPDAQLGYIPGAERGRRGLRELLTLHASLPFQCFKSSMFSLATLALTHQRKKKGSEQLADGVHRRRRGLNAIRGPCCSCTAASQTSRSPPCLTRLSVSPHPASSFLSP